MGKYFGLQCKRLLRFLPGALCVTLILMGSLLGALSLFTRQSTGSEENKAFPLAVCGYTDDPFLQMGLSALDSFDASRFALEVVQMEEQEAARALARGDISAYVVIPEGFSEAFYYGEILPIDFVTTTGASGMVSLVKEEFGNVVGSMLLYSQKGVYGMWDAMTDQDLRHKADGQMTRLALEYVDYIFVRDHFYSLRELGIADSLGLDGYMLCGLSVLFLLLMCLPFAALMVPGDPALGKLLCSKGKSAFLQAVCDFTAYAAALTCVLTVVLLLASFFVPGVTGLFFQILPVLLLAAAFSYMLYSLSRDLIGGVMLQFFVSVTMCFVSGCMYPVHFFPVRVQQLAQWLPTSIARTQLAGCITGSAPQWTAPALLGFCLLFFAAGAAARVRHIKGGVR